MWFLLALNVWSVNVTILKSEEVARPTELSQSAKPAASTSTQITENATRDNLAASSTVDQIVWHAKKTCTWAKTENVCLQSLDASTRTEFAIPADLLSGWAQTDSASSKDAQEWVQEDALTAHSLTSQLPTEHATCLTAWPWKKESVRNAKMDIGSSATDNVESWTPNAINSILKDCVSLATQDTPSMPATSA